jgi:hypothetical protein
MLERLGRTPYVPHPLIQHSSFKEDTCQPVDKVEKSKHILQRNESAHQYFCTFPPTPTHGQL